MRERVEGPGVRQNLPGPSFIRRPGTAYRESNPSTYARYPRASHRDRSLDLRLRLVQSDDIVKHVQIKPKKPGFAPQKRVGSISEAFRANPQNQASLQPCQQLENDMPRVKSIVAWGLGLNAH